MSKSQDLIELELDEMEAKLDETVSGMTSGAVRDALRLVVPMLKDQNRIIRDVLARTPGS